MVVCGQKDAPAGNRTRAARVAGEHSTTEPPAHAPLPSTPTPRPTAKEAAQEVVGAGAHRRRCRRRHGSCTPYSCSGGSGRAAVVAGTTTHDSIHDHLVNLMAQVIRFTARVAIEMFWAAASVYALHLKHCGGRQANTEGGLLGAGIWVLRIADLLLHGKCIAQG